MLPVPRQSLPEQVAAHLRVGIERGRWRAPFPGVPQLSGELDVGRHTVRRALAILEKEGVLDGQGHGRSRSINTLGAAAAAQRPLRIIVRRVVRWVNAVREGRADRRIINIAAEFVPGGSIGPAWGAKAGGASGA